MLGTRANRFLLISSIIYLSGCASEECSAIIPKIMSFDNADIVRTLNELDLRNCRTPDGDNLMTVAITNKNTDAMEILIRHGFDVNEIIFGRSALFSAAIVDCKECAKILLKYRGVFQAPDKSIEYLRKLDHSSEKFWSDIIY